MNQDNQQSTPDPAMNNFLQQLPKGIVDSFSDEQLHHIRNALGVRNWKKHSVDLRCTVPVPFVRQRIYFVFLMGKDRRRLSRQEQKVSTWTIAALMSAFIMISLLFGLLSLYLLKSALGIDLFDGFSLGIWDWL